MRLSNCVNLAQKISAFVLVYFFSFSSYQAQIIPDETLVNNSRVNSGYSVCNQNSNLFDNFNEFSIFDSQLQIKNVFDATQLAAANRTLGEYLQLSGVQISLSESLVSKDVDLASRPQNLQEFFQRTQFSKSSSSLSCQDCENLIRNCIEQGGSPVDCTDLYCSHSDCKRCSVCV